MKRFWRAALSGVVALGMLAMVPGAVFAAQPACGDTLMANTTLTADLDCSAYFGTAITFGKKGITFNLGGHTLWGPVGDDSEYGVHTDYMKNVTVKNGTIADYDIGIYAENTVGGTFKNLTIDGSGADTDDTGIYLYGGADNTIDHVNVNDNDNGLDVEYSGGNWITNNTVTDTGSSAFYLYTEQGDHITGNHATNYGDEAFYDYESGNNKYTNNYADAGTGGGDYGFYIECDDYGWVTLGNNATTGNASYGFYVYECYDSYSYGGFQSSVIDGNTANDNPGGGFYDYYSLQAVYTNNTALRNGDDGFYMDYPGGITFKGNVANRNAGDGVEFADMGYGSYGNPKSVKNNTANRNDDYGINAAYGIGGATGNVARHNGNALANCWNIACN